MILRVLLPSGRTKLYRGEWKKRESPVGWRVLVPTRGGGTTGIVVGVGEGDTEEEIISFPDSASLITSFQLSLLEELSLDYLIPKGILLFKLLPSAFLWKQEEIVYASDRRAVGLDRRSLEIIEYVRKRKGVKPENLKKKFDPELVRFLIKRGFLISKVEWSVPRLEERFYTLSVPLERALKQVRSEERRRLILFLSGKGSVSEEEIKEWGFKVRDLKDLVRRGILSVESTYVGSLKGISFEPKTIQRSRKERILVWGSFEKGLEIVLSVCDRNISEGRSTLILFPDFNDMVNVASALKGMFGDRVIEIHSRVNPKRLVEGWFSARETASVVVGTYVASLCPAKELSSVILFNESSQGVKLRYMGGLDLRRLSYILSKKVGAELVFTTPAPSLSSYLLVKDGRMELEKEKAKAVVEIVKRLPQEILTEEACRLIEKNADRSILFLVPKHGYSYTYCPKCESVVECPECGTFLTYSRKKDTIYCTGCGYKLVDLTCPECGGELEEMGFGIERTLEVVEETFGLRESFHFSTYPEWGSSYDLVVLMSADSMLSVPTYRAREDLFNYILRALYSAREKLVVQTILPEEDIFKLVSEGRFTEFYERELREREKELLPPYWKLILLRSRRKDLKDYIVKTVSPHIRVNYNPKEECYDILIRYRDRKVLRKVAGVMKRFSKDIIEVRVDPF